MPFSVVFKIAYFCSKIFIHIQESILFYVIIEYCLNPLLAMNVKYKY